MFEVLRGFNIAPIKQTNLRSHREGLKQMGWPKIFFLSYLRFGKTYIHWRATLISENNLSENFGA